MINKWNKKLRSNTGSSLILVLMLFFLCVMVSSVVVGVATSSAGRITKREQQQQGYLSVVSAVELAVAEMKNCGKFTGKETATDYGCNEDEDGRMWWVPIYYDEIRTEYHESDADSNSGVDIWEVDAENTNLTGVFADLLKAACTAIYDAKLTEYTNGFTLESGDARLTNVHCDFTMDEDYNITMTFTGAGTSYSITVRFPAYIMTGKEETGISCSHNITYKEPTYWGSYNTVNAERSFDGIATIERTMIGWGTPTISKGVY